ncbi:hypothetical protein O181_060755 [Austropuccinia psidii MF-1]|uniref:Uncharacterized protein n=1 Tax=Austropuccinia psidii MF-1 TaxID=1389203 RepID=A0A9Q3EDW1_9BASI|nr:hypothetical protein [Austropuccinia psidii MF-1]
MEHYRTSTSSQSLEKTFDTLIESPEAEINATPAFRSEQLPTGGSRDIPVSVQELVYGRKAAGVGNSSQLVYRDNELLPSSEKSLGPRKDTRTSEGLETHVLQGTGPKEMEPAFNFKEITRLEELPTFSSEGEYNHMEFMKPIDILTEDINIPYE